MESISIRQTGKIPKWNYQDLVSSDDETTTCETHTQSNKWFVTTSEMTIAEVAQQMGAPSDEHVDYIRQYHPFGENEDNEITHSQKILHTGTEIPWIYHTSNQISHDTDNRGQPSMGVGDVPNIIQQNLRQSNAQQIQVLGDGHCARRALAKNLNMEPGQLIQLISTTCNAHYNLGTEEGEAVIDVRALDYRQIETYANNMAQFAGHNKVKENEQMTCTRDQ